MKTYRSLFRESLILLVIGLTLSACGQKQPAALAGTATQTPIPLSAIATVTPVPTQTPSPAVSPTLAANPSPTPHSQVWKLDNPCASVVNVYPMESGKGWNITALDQNNSKVWDFSQEKIASRFQWQSIQHFARANSSYGVTFAGTDQEQKTWVGYINPRCGKVSLEVLLPVENPGSAYLADTWIEGQGREFWLVDGKKLTLFKAIEQAGQAIWTTDNVPSTALTVTMDVIKDLNQDGKTERLLHWWDWNGSYEQDRRNIKLTQIYREEAPGFTLIGEADPAWQWIDLEGDGTVEFLKAVPPGSTEKWEIYAYQGDRYGWDGEINISPPQEAVPVTVGQLPLLPYDLYFKQEDQGWVWPKTGGKLQPVKVQEPEKNVSTCSGEKINRQILWSPNCRYVTGIQYGAIEGSSSIIHDRQTGKQIEVPNSFEYSQGFSTFAWDPLSQYLIHARAEGGEGLYRIDMPSGKITTLVPFARIAYFTAYGAAFPYILKDSSIVFLVQGAKEGYYPPPGIYRLMPNSELRRLAALSPGKTHSIDNEIYYGDIFPAPGGSMFLFGEPTYNNDLTTHLSMLLVDAEGKTVWDVTSVLGQGSDFRWLP